MLGHRRRRWANINTTTGRHVSWGSESHQRNSIETHWSLSTGEHRYNTIVGVQ